MAIRRGDSPKSKKKAPETKPGHLPPISQTVLNWAKSPGRKTTSALPRKLEVHPFVLANHPPSVFPDGTKLAQDEEISESLAWAAASIPAAYQEGLAFLGYPELALMAQRPEYRRISEIFATEMTRKWIKFKAVSTEDGDEEDDEEDDSGDAEEDDDGKADKTERISELENRFKELDVQGAFRTLAEYDGFMGRAHLYIDTGDTDNPDELTTPIGNGRNDLSKAKMQKGKLRAFRPIEAVWCYPSSYNSVDPLKADWYVPKEWYVMGKRLHASRLLTFIGREVPDLLKPAYSFGGLPLTQMAKPYVDNWLRTRQSVSDLIASFSVFVLKTDLGTILADGSEELIRRAQLFNDLRDNHGLMILNNATEDFINVAASLGSLDHLQAQSQEQICSVSGIPLLKYTGIAPTGLNASTDGEMRSFYDNVHAHQEKFYTKNLVKVMHFVMLDLWGEVDEDIVFEYEPLWSLDEVALASKRKTEQETDSGYIADGVISPKEARKRIASDPTTPYQGLDVDDMPEPPDEGGGMEGMMPGAEGATEPGGEETPTAQSEGSAPAKPTTPSHSAGAAPVASPKVASAPVTKSKVTNAKVPAEAE